MLILEHYLVLLSMDRSGEVLRIVTLGGSTTDGNTEHIWPWLRMGLRCRSGVAGFSTNQELLKLIRDVLPLKPNIIISLNGVNEYGVRASVRFHPLVNIYQANVMEYLVEEPEPKIMPNTLYLFRRLSEKLSGNKPIKRGINYGPKVETKAQEQWLQNIRSMYAVAEEFDIPYLCFLQPALGVGEYQPTLFEKKLLLNDEGIKVHGYLENAKGFYSEAKLYCSQQAFCTCFY